MFSIFLRPKRCGLCYFELPKDAKPLKQHSVSRKITWAEEGQVHDKDIAKDSFDAPLTFSFDDARKKRARVKHTITWGQFQASIDRGCGGCRGLKELLHAAAADDGVTMGHLVDGDIITFEWASGQQRRSGYGLLQVEVVVDASGHRGHRAYAVDLESNPRVKWIFNFDVDLSRGEEESASGAHAHPFAYWWPQGSVFGDTGSSGSTDRIRAWLKECDENHKHCARHARQLPDRVLELSSGSLGEISVRLVEWLREETDYVCLSHRWGPSTPNYRTLKDNISKHTEDIPWDWLPKTFQDAATVTVSLGLNYLWIDSLCIVQDDPKDWEIQAAQMCDIYRGAYVTLGASCSSDSTEGLFRPTPSITIHQGGASGPTYTIRRIPEHPTWDNAGVIQMSSHLPILSRAWVYQERLLSRRMVHYTRYEVLFECSAGVDNLCECGNGPGGFWNGSSAAASGAGESTTLRKQYHAVALTETNLAATRKYWHQVMTEYSGYEISFVSDRLPALAGVARQFGSAHPELGRYVAGLWEATLVYDLMWFCSQAQRMPRPKLPRGVEFPSWSWISVGHYVKINSGCPRVREDDLRVVGFEIEAGSADEYGAIARAELEVEGYVAEGQLVPVEFYGLRLTAFQGAQREPMRFYPDFPMPEVETKGQPEVESTIYCMKTGFAWGGKHLCLVLRKSNLDGSAFERIGMVSEADRSWLDSVFTENLHKQTIKVL